MSKVSLQKPSKSTAEDLLNIQKNELTEYLIYLTLAKSERDPQKSEILKAIALAEKRHYDTLSELTGKKPEPDRLKVIFYSLISKLLGYHFVLKHMENGEDKAQKVYEEVSDRYPELKKIVEEEHEHELQLIELINEEKLEYLSSIVLGLNDGVVELLGTVAGLTFALKSAKLVGLTALIMGIAACLSMSSSEYLSTSTEKDKNPLTAAFYTALSYLTAVFAVVFPFFLLKNVYLALSLSVLLVLMLIAFFNYYIAVVRRERFQKRFAQMSGIIIFVSLVSFLIGFILRMKFKIAE